MRGVETSSGWPAMQVLAILLAGILFVYPLAIASSIPLLDPDEGLHAAIAQEMVEQGDWLVPRLHGEPFLDKPILYFWAQAISLRMLGMSEAAVRLPGLLFGLLGVVTTGFLAARMFNRTTGVLAGLFYATMVLPLALAQAAAHDVALVPWVNLALLCLWESAGQAFPPQRTKRNFRLESLTYVAAAGVFLGLAILTKGLVGVALAGITLIAYLLSTRRLTLRLCLCGAASVGIAAAVASVWYLAIEFRVPGYLHYYFIERHVLGFATETQRHGGSPWWYYLPMLLGGALPWIAYLPTVVQDAWTRWRVQGSTGGGQRSVSPHPEVFLWCWLIGGMLLFSASSSKLVTYIWPIFPSVAILAAVVWARLIEGELTCNARRLLAGTVWVCCLGGPVVLPTVMVVVQREFDIRLPPAIWIAAVATAVSVWAPLWFWAKARYRSALAAAMLALAAHFALVMTTILPRVAPAVSARELALHFNQQGCVPPRLLLAHERVGSLVFYLDPDLRAGLKPGQVRPLKFHQLDELSPPGPGEVLALPESQVQRAERYVDLGGVTYIRVGRYRLYSPLDLAVRPNVAAWGPR